MKSLIRGLLKENFDVINELSQLSTDILRAAIRSFVVKAIKERNSLNVFSSFFNIFDKINGKYVKLKPFLTEFMLTLKFTRNIGEKIAGQFKTFTEDEGMLLLRLSPQQISNTLNKHVLPRLSEPITEETINEMVSAVYQDIITDEIHDIIAHELQHAYDSWRSGGMYVASKAGRKYNSKYSNDKFQLTDKQYYDYLRLPHEVNARFTEVVKRLKPFVKKPDGSIDLVDFNQFKSDFERFYQGFDVITPKMGKRLIKRLYNYYSSIKQRLLNKGVDKLQQKTLRETDLLKENAIGKHLVVVDVQPEYAPWMQGMQQKLFAYINEHVDELAGLTFLYNGEDTMGMVSESEYRWWLVEQGLDENIAYKATLYDKGYAFFRNCMDRGGDDEELVNLVRFMRDNNINDSRELDKKFWKTFVKQYGAENIRELMEDSEDCINIPDLMNFIDRLNNIVLVGGGINECLKEVELALDALDKTYETWGKYTY